MSFSYRLLQDFTLIAKAMLLYLFFTFWRLTNPTCHIYVFGPVYICAESGRLPKT